MAPVGLIYWRDVHTLTFFASFSHFLCILLLTPWSGRLFSRWRSESFRSIRSRIIPPKMLRFFTSSLWKYAIPIPHLKSTLLQTWLHWFFHCLFCKGKMFRLGMFSVGDLHFSLATGHYHGSERIEILGTQSHSLLHHGSRRRWKIADGPSGSIETYVKNNSLFCTLSL